MIIRGGYNVYPREIEEVLYEHPAVREAAVVGVPHDEPRRGGRRRGRAQGRSRTSRAEELRTFVKEQVAAYKYPRRVWFVDELPKGPTGKILKREIEPPAATERRVERRARAVTDQSPPGPPPSLATIALQWTRIGLTGFGGPPAHVALLRRLVVDRRHWMEPREFEDANAACGLLPGPASTQLAIFCAYRVGGPAGRGRRRARLHPPRGHPRARALDAVPRPRPAARGCAAPERAPARRSRPSRSQAATLLLAELRAGARRHARACAGRATSWRSAAAGALVGPYLVLVLLACGLLELAAQRRRVGGRTGVHALPVRALAPAAVAVGGLRRALLDGVQGRRAVLRRRLRDRAADAGRRRPHLSLDDERGLPQRGRARSGHAGPGRGDDRGRRVRRARHRAAGSLAAVVAFTPSFSFILLGGRRFERLRENAGARAFLDGAGPAAIGAILGAAIPLAGALGVAGSSRCSPPPRSRCWSLGAGSCRRCCCAGAVGAIVALAGGPLPR